MVAHVLNPYINGLIPGTGYIRSGDYTGLWHFIHMGAGTMIMAECSMRRRGPPGQVRWT